MGEPRERRLVFGEDPERYDRARPTYPSAIIDDLVELVGTDARVIDVGTGTAKGTRLLAERGLTGVGVEADPAMAAVGRRHLDRYPGWRIDESDFEAWTPTTDDAPADLLTAAQAWHWVGPSGSRRAHEWFRGPLTCRPPLGLASLGPAGGPLDRPRCGPALHPISRR